ncbi:N/A [soil metagenome]
MWAQPARFDSLSPTHAALAYSAEARRGIAPRCDVYLPSGKGPHPSVIVVHGGGWIVGNRQMKPVRFIAMRLCRAGFAVCSIDYRLLLRGGALDAQLGDVNAAAAYFRAECTRFDCDPDRISMLGFSAGAALMLLHAGAISIPYHRLVNVYGALDFHRMPAQKTRFLLGMLLGTRDLAEWERRSPSAHIGISSPILTIHGSEDALVPVDHATRFHEARLARGLPSELVVVPGMDHGFLNDASLSESEDAVSRVVAFLRAPVVSCSAVPL